MIKKLTVKLKDGWDTSTKEQRIKNEKIKEKLGKEIITLLNDVDISWLENGDVVISCDDTLGQIRKCLTDCKLELTTPRNDIKHRVTNADVEEVDEDIELVNGELQVKKRNNR